MGCMTEILRIFSLIYAFIWLIASGETLGLSIVYQIKEYYIKTWKINQLWNFFIVGLKEWMHYGDEFNYVIMGIGILCFIQSILGIVGIARKNRCMIITYLLILACAMIFCLSATFYKLGQNDNDKDGMLIGWIWSGFLVLSVFTTSCICTRPSNKDSYYVNQSLYE